jgi:hypothetical protein
MDSDFSELAVGQAANASWAYPVHEVCPSSLIHLMHRHDPLEGHQVFLDIILLSTN